MAFLILEPRVERAAGTYPWARYWAKWVDLSLATFPVALLAQAMFHSSEQWVILALCQVVYPPSEAFMLALWGTTPGKALFRISVVGEDGEKLRLPLAMRRSYAAWFRGLGAAVPIVCIITAINGYMNFTREGVTSWDRDMRTTFLASRPNWWSWVGFVLLAFALAALLAIGESQAA